MATEVDVRVEPVVVILERGTASWQDGHTVGTAEFVARDRSRNRGGGACHQASAAYPACCLNRGRSPHLGIPARYRGR